MTRTASPTRPTIRRAEPRDAAALALLFADAAMLPFTTITPHTSVAFWEKRLADYADVSCLPLVAVANEGDSIIGILLLRSFAQYIRRKHCSTIDLLAVRPDFRRNGVGRALVSTAIAAADEGLQLRRIETSIAAESTALKKFYESLGFVAEGVKRGEIVHSGRYVDRVVLSRINASIMPASASTALPAKKRPRKLAAPKILVRPATEDDADGFAKVFSDRSASSGTLQHPYTSSEVWRTRLAANAGHAGTRQVQFVALVNGRVVGNAGLHPVNDNPRQKHVCTLGVAVADAYQGRGVGRALMNACLDFADKWANYARVELTVHADNDRAVELYQSLGFEHEGRLRDYSFREGGYVDALFMGRLTQKLTGAV
jgi:L-phenylalanine/L-methionine N-acetyltransferase